MFDQVLWFATRGAGAVSLIMLTASLCFGMVVVTRFQHPEWPRFLNYEMHRRISLLAIVFLAVHVLAAVFDPFTSLGLAAALVPLASTYRPIPMALGVIALYLFAALIATSLLRKHIGQKTWRAIHWTSYAMWPLAVTHGISVGTDGSATWMLVIDVACLGAVAACLAWRLRPRARMAATPGMLPADDRRRLIRCASWSPKTTPACATSSSSGSRTRATTSTPSSAATTRSTSSSGTTTTSRSSTGGCPARPGIDVVAWARKHEQADRDPHAHRARHAARPDPGPRRRAPTTTSSSPSTSASCSPASARSSAGRAASTRRSSRAAGSSSTRSRREVAVDGRERLNLTPTEYQILELLMRRSPAVVDRKAIAEHAWEDETDPLGSNAIDVQLSRLRAKLPERRRPDRDRPRRGLPAGGGVTARIRRRAVRSGPARSGSPSPRPRSSRVAYLVVCIAVVAIVTAT